MSRPTDQTAIGLESNVPREAPTTTDELHRPSAGVSASGDLPEDGEQRIDRAEPEEADKTEPADEAAPAAKRFRRFSFTRVLTYGLLPLLALALTLAAGYVKWEDGSARASQAAAAESVRVASETTVAILSYRPDTAEKELKAAADRLTGTFRDQYTDLITTVVIPGAQQQQISAVATVPAAASVSASEDRASVLVFINQTTLIGSEPPSTTTSCVRITLDKIGGRWLVSEFEPV
jgi:Mce-associated membrane protein